MKVKIREIREFRFTMTEEEFSVLQDALYEHSNNSPSNDNRVTAMNMRDTINEALRMPR